MAPTRTYSFFLSPCIEQSFSCHYFSFSVQYLRGALARTHDTCPTFYRRLLKAIFPSAYVPELSWLSLGVRWSHWLLPKNVSFRYCPLGRKVKKESFSVRVNFRLRKLREVMSDRQWKRVFFFSVIHSKIIGVTSRRSVIAVVQSVVSVRRMFYISECWAEVITQKSIIKQCQWNDIQRLH